MSICKIAIWPGSGVQVVGKYYAKLALDGGDIEKAFR